MVIEEQAVTMCYISKEEENQEMTGFTSVHYNNCSIRIPKKKNCSIRIYFNLFYCFYKLRSFAISWLILLPHNKTKKNLGPCKFVQDLGTWNVLLLCSGQVPHTNRSFNQISQFLSKKKRKKIQIGQLFTQNYFL